MRCRTSAPQEAYVHLAPLALHKSAIELADGCQVLLDRGCSLAAIPLVRSLFETYLSAMWILRDDKEFEQRSLCWIVTDRKSEIRLLSANTQSTSHGKQQLRIYKKRLDSLDENSGEIDQWISRWEAILSEAPLDKVSSEYQATLERRRNRPPEFYSLYGGPGDRRALARSVGKEAEYLTVYGPWSAISHAGKFESHIESGSFAKIRTYDDYTLGHLAVFAAMRLFEIDKQMLAKYRPLEPLKPLFEELKPFFANLQQIVDESK